MSQACHIQCHTRYIPVQEKKWIGYYEHFSLYLPDQRRRGASPKSSNSICRNNCPCGTKYYRRMGARDWKKSGKEHATAMWQVSLRWEPQRTISLLHTCFEKVDLYSAHQQRHMRAEKYEQGWRHIVVANPDNAPAKTESLDVLQKPFYAPESSCCPTLPIYLCI